MFEQTNVVKTGIYIFFMWFDLIACSLRFVIAFMLYFSCIFFSYNYVFFFLYTQSARCLDKYVTCIARHCLIFS